MGVYLIRGFMGSTLKNSKQIIITAIAKYISILGSTADVSLNAKLASDVKVELIRPSGSPMWEVVKSIDDKLFKELLMAKRFKIEFDVKSGSWKTHVLFWYDEEYHKGTSFNFEFSMKFPESVSFKLLGLIGSINVQANTSIRTGVETALKRLYDLLEKVFKMYAGPSMIKSKEEYYLRKYEVDSIFLNVFGKFVKVREGPD